MNVAHGCVGVGVCFTNDDAEKQLTADAAVDGDVAFYSSSTAGADHLRPVPFSSGPSVRRFRTSVDGFLERSTDWTNTFGGPSGRTAESRLDVCHFSGRVFRVGKGACSRKLADTQVSRIAMWEFGISGVLESEGT